MSRQSCSCSSWTFFLSCPSWLSVFFLYTACLLSTGKTTDIQWPSVLYSSFMIQWSIFCFKSNDHWDLHVLSLLNTTELSCGPRGGVSLPLCYQGAHWLSNQTLCFNTTADSLVFWGFELMCFAFYRLVYRSQTCMHCSVKVVSWERFFLCKLMLSFILQWLYCRSEHVQSFKILWIHLK